MKLERIVIGIDFSSSSFEAARWAARHFASGAELVLAHIITVPQPPPIVRSRYARRDLLIETVRAGADRRLREFSHALSASRIWLEIREGEAASGLANVAADFSADLVIVGMHGEREGVLEGLGSTAEHLVKQAHTPVLLTRALRDRPPARILVPLEQSEISERALGLARHLGHRFGAEVIALHVVRSGVMSHMLSGTAGINDAHRVGSEPLPSGGPLAAHGWLQRLLEESKEGAGRASAQVVFGEPAQEITAFAERWDCDLIVMGRRGAGGIRRAVLGSVVNALLRHAPCPVLVMGERDAS
ncbi:MAG: universal stress protein [Gemmatimonadota bacterium]